MTTPLEWERIAREKGLLIGEPAPVRVDLGHLRPASGTYSERRRVMTDEDAGRLVTPPPDGLSGVELVIALRVRSEMNERGHWTGRRKRFAVQKAALEAVLDHVTLPRLPVGVRWTKIGGGRLDSDNLAGSFKGLRDALAARYGVDDSDGSGIEWDYEQEPGGRHGVRVLIAAAHLPAAPPAPNATASPTRRTTPMPTERDPRVDPRPGDTFRKGNLTRILIAVEPTVVAYRPGKADRFTRSFISPKVFFNWIENAEVISRAD